MPYQEFASAVSVVSGVFSAEGFVPTQEGRLIDGVRFLTPEIIVDDERRTLVVICNSRDVGMDGQTPLVYVVVVKPPPESEKSYYAGNHYHRKRLERIEVVSGRAKVVLYDCRLASKTMGVVNVLELDRPDCVIEVPPGVAHTVKAEEGSATLVVHASCDHHPDDDFHVDLLHV